MIITDRHARGLAKDFIDSLPHDIKEANKINQKKIKSVKIRDRHDFAKYIDVYNKAFNKFLICQFVGGSKRNPYQAFIGVSILEARAYDNWTEQSITGIVFIESVDKKLEDGSQAIFMIGEHAIKRIFERSGIVDLNVKYDRYCLLNEIRFLPIWAGFWHLLLIKLESIPEEVKSKICPVVPTENGLLMCKLTSIDNHQFLEVRTFLHSSRLNEIQKTVREKMIMATSSLQDSLLCLYPYHIKVPNFNPLEIDLIFNLISSRLINECTNLCNLISRDANEFNLYQFNNRVKQIMSETHTSLELYEHIGRKMQEIGYNETINLLLTKNDIALFKEVDL